MRAQPGLAHGAGRGLIARRPASRKV